MVFVENVKGAMRITACCQTAATLGLTPGTTLADARARVPDLHAVDHAPHDDHDWLEALADGCGRYTPGIMLDAPDGLVLDIAGCVHGFDDERGLAEDIEARLARRGVRVRWACGDTPDAARALARFQTAAAPDEDEAIRRLAVVALGLGEEATLALSRAGLKTIGDVACRPLSAIAARFGGDAVTSIRRILGEEDSPLTPRIFAQPVRVERRFAEPVARTEYALEILGELAAEAVLILEQAGEGGRRFEARFFRSDGMVMRLAVETGQPSRDVKALLRLFRERIDGLSDPVDPGYGFDLIRLDVPLAEPLGASQLKLEDGAVAEVEVAALIDRLSTRLGRGRVRRFVPRDTHIPEQAELLLPAVERTKPVVWAEPEAGEPPLRPIHLFDPPQPIMVTAEVPDGPPRQFTWRRKLHDVARMEGPERIAPEWWKRRDGKGLTRDYYRIEDIRGRRFWIFRHGLYDEVERPDWYVHGLFA